MTKSIDVSTLIDINEAISKTPSTSDLECNDDVQTLVCSLSPRKEVLPEEPRLGLHFISIEDAYKYYKNYAGMKGFNVRKNHIGKNTNGFVTRATFCCSQEGFRKADKRSVNASYQKPITRVGCKAKMTCNLGENGRYGIVKFNADHNHDLVRTPMKHLLKVNRSISKARCITNYTYSMFNDNPKDSMGKRYSHLCRNFREIASCAAEDDKLTKYANDCLVELLRNLEEMKRTSISNGETSVRANEGVEQAITITELDIATTNQTPTGVKKKATVGRPRGRFKDPLERNKRKPKEKTRTVARKKHAQEPYQITSSYVKEKPACGDATTFYDDCTEEDTNLNAFIEGRNHIPLTLLLECSMDPLKM